MHNLVPIGRFSQLCRLTVKALRFYGHESAGPPREVYLTGPGQARNEDEYRTELTWPLR